MTVLALDGWGSFYHQAKEVKQGEAPLLGGDNHSKWAQRVCEAPVENIQYVLVKGIYDGFSGGGNEGQLILFGNIKKKVSS